MAYDQATADALREALVWRRRYETLAEAVDEYRLWEPGRKGHAAAHRRLMAVLDEEASRDL